MDIPNIEELQNEQIQKAQMEEQRAMILDQILEPEAKARLTRLSMVKPDKARAVESSLIKAGTSGQLKSKVTEAQLITMLEQISGPEPSSSDASKGKKGLVIQRRNYGLDDDDDNDDDLL